MHGSPLPLLSLWSARPGTAEGRLPAGLERVDGVADSAEAALRRAAAQAPGRAVLVCEVSAHWPEDGLERLLAAWRTLPDASVLSPLDRGALTPPHDFDRDAMDAFCWAYGDHGAVPNPRHTPAASLWRGGLAADTAGAAVAPRWWLPCLWIDAESPGSDALAGESLARLREKLADTRAEAVPDLTRDRPVLLHVLHAWGGGVERFARDLAAADTERQHLFLVADSDDHQAPFGRLLRLHHDLDHEPLRRWRLAPPIADTALASDDYRALLTTLCREWGVGAVLVSSLIGHSLDALRTGLPTAYAVHDAYPFWPLLHHLPEGPADAVGEHVFAALRAESGNAFPFATRPLREWTALRHATLAALRAADVTLVAPSVSAQDMLQHLAPALADLHWQRIAHGNAPMTPLPNTRQANDADAPLRVLIPGRLDGGKGEHLLDRLLPQLPSGIELVLLGCGHRIAQRYAGRAHVTLVPDFRHAELAAEVARAQPDLALLPSTVPETWSYALSEMQSLGLPCVVPARGALGERVATNGFGWCVAPDADAVAAQLRRLADDRTEIAALRQRPAPILPTLAEMAAAWSQVLPAARIAPQLCPMEAAALARADAAAIEQALRRTLGAQSESLVELDTEVKARGDWALELQASLQASQVQLDSQRHERAQLTEQLHASSQYYARDTTDLARQRDVAVNQRDELQREVAAMQASRSWTLTRPLRDIARLLRRQYRNFSYRCARALWLWRRGSNSLRTRGIGPTWRRWQQWRAQESLARTPPSTAALAPPAVAIESLRLPDPESPIASVIIPVHGQIAFTLACLQSLMASGDRTAFEVIVVDDASPDASGAVLPGIPGLHYLRNEKNLGFIGTCNAGAAAARGEFLVFLNNDTRVRPGWLDALLATFAQHPDTGLAGSKLIYPDGRLQEAGGLVFADGSGWNYGRFDDPADPRYNLVRETDYCSGAAIAVPRDVFRRLGGFDSHYAPAYYEDTDLAMRVRGLGLKVRYQPGSEVIHYEGITSGTDVRAGIKAHQASNQVKFHARWRETLAAQHPKPEASALIDRAARHRQQRQVLVVDACTPTPDRDSGSVRMLEIMRLLAEEGCAVSFFAENLAHDAHYTEALQQLGVEAWWHPWIASVPAWLEQHGRRFDLIIVSRHYVLSPLLPLLREYAPQARIVFDTVDLHFLREAREAEQTADGTRRQVAQRTRDTELRLIRQSDLTWVVSGYEQTLLRDIVPEATVEIVSNIHPTIPETPGFHERQDLVFVGGYRHPPNVDAALWLADEIFPLIRRERADIRLHLVGAEAPAAILALGEREGIVFHGHVPDLDALLDRSRISLAPLRYGAGVKGKVNQSLARGLPTVATSIAVEGMHLRDGDDVLMASDAASFAAAVLRLYGDPTLWQRLREGGWDNTHQHFSRDAARAAIRPLLASLRIR